MKIVVTGGAGRLGRYVIKELLGHGHEALSIDTVVPAEQACPSFAMDLREVKGLLVSLKARRRLCTGSNTVSLHSQWLDLRGGVGILRMSRQTQRDFLAMSRLATMSWLRRWRRE